MATGAGDDVGSADRSRVRAEAASRAPAGRAPDRERASRHLTEPERAVVLYDRDCGFCRWTLARLLSLDRRRRLRPVAIQSSEAERLLPDMTPERRLASAHLVTPDGRVLTGGDAVAPLLRLLPGGAPLGAAAGLVPGLWRVGYDWVAARRGTFGPRIPRSAVERATARIDAHG